MRILIFRFLDTVKTALPELKILLSEHMSRHTSFRIGGPAAVMVFPRSVEELSKVRKILNEFRIAPLILGGGTNILAPDAGLDRVVICLKDALDGLRLCEPSCVEAYAGVSMARTALFAKDAGLSGLEFSHGIPGTVGGGVYMNAGAYGGELAQVTKSVTVMEKDGTVREIICDENTFGYRTSIFEDTDLIILKAVFALKPCSSEEIFATMQDLMERRKRSQPLELPSAGSTFKRPVGGFAAALIDEAGLKGYSVGGAAVSEKHAGFVVNLGNATSADVLALVEQVKTIVQERSGVTLTPEIRIW